MASGKFEINDMVRVNDKTLTTYGKVYIVEGIEGALIYCDHQYFSESSLDLISHAHILIPLSQEENN